jgi:hypothetical protein
MEQLHEIFPAEEPPLSHIHSDSDLRRNSSYDYWKRQNTSQIVNSLRPGQGEPLTVTPDGRIFDGNTRILVLRERNYDVNSLPRTTHRPARFDDF